MQVNTTNDLVAEDGKLSLREAMELATGLLSFNALPSEVNQIRFVTGNVSTITFAGGLTGSTVTLSTVGDETISASAFLVNSSVIINGPGNGGITLSAADGDDALQCDQHRQLDLAEPYAHRRQRQRVRRRARELQGEAAVPAWPALSSTKGR